MQRPLVFIESICLTYDLGAIERDISHTVRETVVQITDEDVYKLMRARFSSIPSPHDTHAVCVPYGITWGDLATEMLRSGRGQVRTA
jgi:hypothetical protein